MDWLRNKEYIKALFKRKNFKLFFIVKRAASQKPDTNNTYTMSSHLRYSRVALFSIRFPLYSNISILLNPFSAGTAFMHMQTGWIQASRRVTRQLAWYPTCLPLSVSFPIKKAEFTDLNSRQQYNLFLENYPAFKGLSDNHLVWISNKSTDWFLRKLIFYKISGYFGFNKPIEILIVFMLKASCSLVLLALKRKPPGYFVLIYLIFLNGVFQEKVYLWKHVL